MTDTTITEPRSKGSGIMISYNELVLIRTSITALISKVDTALALKVAFDELEKRVRYLELDRAEMRGGGFVMKHLGTAVVALVSALIGAVVPALMH